MQSRTTIKRTSFLTALAVLLFSSGALLGRTVPNHEGSCALPSGTGGSASDTDHVHSLSALPGEPGGIPATVQGSDGTIVFPADTTESTTTCRSVLFEDDNGDGISLDYDQLDAIAWNSAGTVFVVEHPARHVILEGAHLDLLLERFRKHACGLIAVTELPPAEDGGATSTDDEVPGDPNEPFIARVRLVPPDAYHFGKNGEYVSGEAYP
jgi:hypothetical protein